MILSQGPLGVTEIVRNPTWEAVEAAIRAVDAGVFADACLGELDDMPLDTATHMIIGGSAGRFLVSANPGGARHHTLVNPKGSTHERVQFVVSGQLVDIETRYCVDLTTVLRAAKTFFAQEELDASCSWE